MKLKNLDVLLFNPSIENGGVEKNLVIFSKLLKNKVKNITVISSSIDKRKLFDKKINFKTFNKKKIKSNKRYIYYLYSFLALISFILKNKEKEILIISFQSNVLSIFVAKIFKKKIIIRLNTSPNKYVHNVFQKFFFKYIYKMSDLIIVNSHIFKKKIKETFNLNSNVIYNFINKINFRIRKKKNKTLSIITIGRLTYQKDQITLLKAIKIVSQNIKCKLLIIGEGHLINKLKNYIKNNRLKNVSFHGNTSNPEHEIAKADLFVLTSKYEGMPNVLIEALQCKTYIISTNCQTGPSELLKNGKFGSLIPVGNYKLIANEILKYSKKPSFFKKKIALGYNSLFRFNNEKNFSAYLNLITKL